MSTMWEEIYYHGYEEDGLSWIQPVVEDCRQKIVDRFSPFLQFLSARESGAQMMSERDAERMLEQIEDGILEDLQFEEFREQVEIEKANEESFFKSVKRGREIIEERKHHDS